MRTIPTIIRRLAPLAVTLTVAVLFAGCGGSNAPLVPTASTVAVSGTINTGGFAGRAASANASLFSILAVPDTGTPVQADLQGTGNNGSFALSLLRKRYQLLLVRRSDPTQQVSQVRFPTAGGSTPVLPLDQNLGSGVTAGINIGTLSSSNGVMTVENSDTRNPLRHITDTGGNNFATSAAVADTLSSSEAAINTVRDTVLGGAPRFTASSPTSGTVGTAYTYTFTATDANSDPLTFTATGTLPGGLTLSTAGVLSGTPTAAGTFSFTVKVTDGKTTTSADVTMGVITSGGGGDDDNQGGTGSPPQFTGATVQSATLGQAFTLAVAISDADTSASALTLTSSNLPSWLTISGLTLSGTPTVTGSVNITLVVTDNTGNSATQFMRIDIAAPTGTAPHITSGNPSQGTVGQAYSYTFTASDAQSDPVTFSITGTLPTGLTLSGAVLSGTPTQDGSFPITLVASDGTLSESNDYTLVIAAAQTTGNGGYTWTSRALPALTAGSRFQGVSDVHCTDANTCYAVGGFSGTTTDDFVFHKTTDAGATWTAMTAPKSVPTQGSLQANAVQFTSANVGYAWGQHEFNGFLWKTTDAGSTWTALEGNQSTAPFNTTPGQNEQTMFWLDDSNGFLVTQDAVMVYKTTDGGGTWTAQNLPAVPQGQIRHFISSFTCVDASNCMMVTTNNTATHYVTGDGGANWTQLGNWPTGFDGTLRTGTMASASVLVGIGNLGEVLWSSDRGQSWTLKEVKTSSFDQPDEVHCQSATLCVAKGTFEAMFITRDGGGTWDRFTPGNLDGLNDRMESFFFLNAGTVFVPMNKGRVRVGTAP